MSSSTSAFSGRSCCCSFFRRHLTRTEVAAVSVALLGLLANAAVCGILSAVTERYQGRVAWILPALALILLLRIRSEKPAADRMEYVPLGKSGLVTSVIGLGGGSSGRFGLTKGGTRADAIRLIRSALDQGITFFDGAGICGGVDELLAEGLADRRDDVVLSTKVHLGPDPYPFSAMRLANQASSWAARRLGSVCTARTIRKRVEQTLKALRTDRIDLLHLHAVTPRQLPLAAVRVLPELTKMKAEGKIRAIGITEAFLADPGHVMLRQAVKDARFDAIMTGSISPTRARRRSILPAATKAGMGVIGMFALRGLLGSERLRRIVDGGRRIQPVGSRLSLCAASGRNRCRPYGDRRPRPPAPEHRRGPFAAAARSGAGPSSLKRRAHPLVNDRR